MPELAIRPVTGCIGAEIQGLDLRLTGVEEAHPIKGILA